MCMLPVRPGGLAAITAVSLENEGSRRACVKCVPCAAPTLLALRRQICALIARQSAVT